MSEHIHSQYSKDVIYILYKLIEAEDAGAHKFEEDFRALTSEDKFKNFKNWRDWYNEKSFVPYDYEKRNPIMLKKRITKRTVDFWTLFITNSRLKDFYNYVKENEKMAEDHFLKLVIEKTKNNDETVPDNIAQVNKLIQNEQLQEKNSNKKHEMLPEEKFQNLLGAWYVYYFDSNEDGVYRTMLWLEHINNDYRISLKTSWDSKNIKTGIGKIYGRALKIVMDNELPHLTLMAKLPSKEIKNDERAMLNTTGVIFSEAAPIQINLILVKDWSATNEQVFLNNGINQVKYEPLPKNYSIKERSVEEDHNEIIIYLTRHQDRIVKPFYPQKDLHIVVRNNKYHEKKDRAEFIELKKKFDKNVDNNSWFSFSRVVNDKDKNDNKEKITFFKWKFDFHPSKQKVIVERERKGHSLFIGEATLYNENLNIAMKAEKIKYSKTFTAVVPFFEDVTVIEGISSTVNSNQSTESLNLAVREILFFCPDSMFTDAELKNGLITYDRFLDFDGLSTEKKLYLANRDASILSYPRPEIKAKQHYRRTQASIFEGDYYLIMRKDFNMSAKKKELYCISLTIDKLANVSLIINTKTTSINKYWGFVHYFDNNLHMQLESEVVVSNFFKIKSLIFDPNLSISFKPEFFSGVSLNISNQNNDRCLLPFIMVAKKLLSKNFYPSEILKNPELNELENLTKKNIGKTVMNYFFI